VYSAEPDRTLLSKRVGDATSLLLETSKMTSRSRQGKVRDFEMTLEDAARLAKCLNTFDDADSWPGGFTHGNPFTAERVLDEKKKSQTFRVLVAYSGDDIVGTCDIAESIMDKEAAYVGVLGVNPGYQGQGFGKALLTEATNTTAELGCRRLDLHTWGGNLKAMPLYKRVGFNWVPGTRVLMESYVPSIISSPMFKEFFDRYDWYDTLQREIRQEVDDLVDDNVGVFKYYFKGENEDYLDVTIDREAKGICGFSMGLGGQGISVTITPQSHSGYIGYDGVPIVIRVENETSADLPFSLEAKGLQHFVIHLESPASGVLLPGKEAVIKGTYSITEGAEHLDRTLISDTKVETQAEWSLTLGDQTMSLYSGLIPKDLLKITSGPRHPSLSPGESKSVELYVLNNAGESVTGEVEVTGRADVKAEELRTRFTLEPETLTAIPVDIAARSTDESSLLTLNMAVYVFKDSERVLIRKQTLNIPVLGAASALVYEDLNSLIVLETERIRLGLRKTPPMIASELEYKTLGKVLSGWFLWSEVGYPFPSEGSEWSRKKFKVGLTNGDAFSEVTLEADSEERPGLRFFMIYRIYPGRNYIEVSTRLENQGAEKLENLGIRIRGWVDPRMQSMYAPIRDNIYVLDSVEWSGFEQLPKKPAEYHEPWIALTGHDERGLMGYIWNHDGITEVRPKRKWRMTQTEYKLPNLSQGESVEKTLLWWVIGSGSWREVRSLWARLSGSSIKEMEPVSLKSDLEVELRHESCSTHSQTGAPVFVDASKNNKMEICVSVAHGNPVSASIVLQMPGGLLVDGQREVHFVANDIKLGNPFVAPVSISVQNNDRWLQKSSEVRLKFKKRNTIIPLTFITYDSGCDVLRESSDVEGFDLHTLRADGIIMSASAGYTGNLVRFGLEGQDSVFYDTFPRAEPFIWWDRFFTGLAPIAAGWGVWDWESSLSMEKWSILEKNVGPWTGYEVTSKFCHSPGLKGLEFRASYLMLPGVPVLRAEISAENKSSEWKRFSLGFRGVPRLSGPAVSNVHTVINGKRVFHQPTKDETEVAVDPKDNWAVYEEPSSGQVLGVSVACKTRDILELRTLGENAQAVTISDWRELEPRENTAIVAYFPILSNPEDMIRLKYLPETTG
jgi:ribosomal protein S18 acetylase RimI-like enzyme